MTVGEDVICVYLSVSPLCWSFKARDGTRLNIPTKGYKGDLRVLVSFESLHPGQLNPIPTYQGISHFLLLTFHCVAVSTPLRLFVLL